MDRIDYMRKKKQLSAKDVAKMPAKNVQQGILDLLPDDLEELRDKVDIVDLRNLRTLLDEVDKWEFARDKQDDFKNLKRAIKGAGPFDLVSLREYNDEELANVSSFGARASVVDAVFEARAARFTSAAPPRVPAA